MEVKQPAMKHIVWILLLVLIRQLSVAQEPFPFYNEVSRLKQQDSTAFPRPNSILLIGSSSFTMWRDVNDYFPGKQIVNRAFGGSTLLDLIRYRYDVIYPYQPKRIIMYCGENDFASSDTVTVDLVLKRFNIIYTFIRQRFPKVSFVYVSMKPSPSRQHLLEKYQQANTAIAEFLSKQSNTGYVDVYTAMLDSNGMPKEDIFLNDRLHMNAAGYKIWQGLLSKWMK